MKSVASIVRQKPDQRVHRVAPQTKAPEAARLMAEYRVGALLVMDGEQIIGIVTERDFLRKVVLDGRSSSETQVREIMTTQVMYVSPAQTNSQCMALMTENRLRHLPVMDQGKLVGLVSIGDLVKDIISEQEFVIDQLTHYITGEPA